MKEAIIKYKRDELTVLWKPHVCSHSAKCWKGLSTVFNPTAKPWVNVNGAEVNDIIHQIDQCPSGALSYELNSKKNEINMETTNVKIQIAANGPILVEGGCVIINKDGTEELKEGKFALCRCGQSTKKPYCDGSHRTTEFDK